MEIIAKSILEISYLIASVLFIVGLKMLSNPESARKGNILAAIGMGMAIIATMVFHKTESGENMHNLEYITGAIVLGTAVGWAVAVKVKMTAMPQLVSIFNGMGGACAAIISMMEFPNIPPQYIAQYGMGNGQVFSILLGLMIGTVSFTGSMIAFGKLNGNIGDTKTPVLRYINIGLLLILIGFIVFIMTMGKDATIEDVMPILYLFTFISVIYGILFVMPIGGADMPVVISLLNSFTGVAAAMGGFLYDNRSMLTGGILVGSAGTILTILMCKAMNRSLWNVIVGSFGGNAASSTQEVGTIKEISLSDSGVLLSYSQKVVIVPGYGLAVAQAQHLCHELEKLLEEKGVELKYGIHPVAGRMPGHMNVLLAEADVSYDKLVELDDINNDMQNTDVVIIIGANDVVNPAAENDPGSPIYGMPVIKAWEAKNVIVMKRGMGKGYAAIENMLFFHERTRMLFGDAKATLQKLVSEVKSL